MRGGFPVSYPHLDVYKRQLVVLAGEVFHGEHPPSLGHGEFLVVHIVGVGLGEDDAPRPDEFLRRKAFDVDVYKRQTVVPTSSGNTEKQLKFMRDFGTDTIVATPSYLSLIHI